jgi:HD-GYP domain-containing protein (c-di-GMP phosphodiesterase class II)
MLLCISNAVDLISEGYTSHHQQVAFLSYHIGRELGLEDLACRDLLMAGMLHDIGALSNEERLMLVEEEPLTVNSHAFRSAKLLEEAAPFSAIADTVRYHHIHWASGAGARFQEAQVPIGSHILYLADRVCVKFNTKQSAIEQVPIVLQSISQNSDSKFLPEAVQALEKLKNNDHIWLALLEPAPLVYLPTERIFAMMSLNINEILDVTRMMSFIIDFRSHFTATHSAGVAAVSHKLGELCGFSDVECKMLLIAGYLHDLGKLTVPNSVLEKPAALNHEEFNIIRGHTFHTYRLLKNIDGFDVINKWASYHHEKLNGKGYPFQLSGENIPLGSRIMAVADIFTSITEDRPYRSGMSKSQIVKILNNMAEQRAICCKVVDRLTGRLDEFIELCLENQQREASIYKNFFSIAG